MRGRDYQEGELVPGTVYRVMRLIGAGGMGTVYDVEDITVGKRFVLKTLHPKLGARDDLARRIQKEARTLGRLNHPNIVEVITAGVTADSMRLPYFVMERLSGQSLRVILEKKGQLELSHAYHIGIDLLDALDHAHDKNVIHRDVKPDNIFLHRSAAGLTITKLLDFGIVSVLDATHRETAGRFLGTLRYAAPEQLRGEKPTPKTDVYATALVLYEIVAGRGPFDDEGDASAIAAAHMSKRPPPVSERVRVPREFDVLLTAALSKNPDMRPRDAFSFAASLRNLKRRLEEARPRTSTDSRVTAMAMIAPESSGRLPAASSRPTAGGTTTPSLPPAPALPGGPSVPGYVPQLPPMRPVLTTLVGMPTPTAPPGAGTAGAASSATVGDAVDRAAATRTMSPEALSLHSAPTPPHGTEAMPFESSLKRDAIALGEASTDIQWPSDRLPIPSVEPQVRSLASASSARRRSFAGKVLPRAAAGAAIAAIAVVAAVLQVTARHRVPAATVPPATAAAAAPAAPVSAPPAPAASALAPPAAAAASTEAASTPSVAVASSLAAAVPAPSALPPASAHPPAAHAKPVAVAAPHAARPQLPTGFGPERPGPGF